jgi:hypothetical protein
MKVKDLVLVAILGALNLVVSMIVTFALFPLGAYAHCISPGVAGLFTGVIFVFLCNKVGKKGSFLLFSSVYLIAMAASGFYLPWIISYSVAFVIGEILLVFMGYKNKIAQFIAFGLIQVGSACGQIIPVNFFLESFKNTWLGKGGVTESALNEMIKFSTGTYGLISLLIVFILGGLGVVIGNIILKKHFKKI